MTFKATSAPPSGGKSKTIVTDREEVLGADVEFFAMRPKRRYFLRPAAAIELIDHRVHKAPPRPGMTLIAAVYSAAPNERQRIFIQVRPDQADLIAHRDLGEFAAKTMWDYALPRSRVFRDFDRGEEAAHDHGDR